MEKIKKFLPLIIAACLGLLALFLFNVYMQQQAQQAKEEVITTQKRQTTVVVARQDIASGAIITEAMVREETVNRDLLQPMAAISIDRVINKAALAPIGKGEQILLNKVSATGAEVSLASKVPKDKRAITIPVDNISAVGGMLRPGDHVDILGVIPMQVKTAEGKQATQMSSMPLFQDVLVLAVGQEYTTVPGAEKGEKRVSPTVTLALAPDEANLVAFVQEQGKIRLVLRSPQDTSRQPVAPATWEAVLRKVMPGYAQAVPEEEGFPQKRNTVEIIRGQTREVKELK